MSSLPNGYENLTAPCWLHKSQHLSQIDKSTAAHGITVYRNTYYGVLSLKDVNMSNLTSRLGSSTKNNFVYNIGFVVLFQMKTDSSHHGEFHGRTGTSLTLPHL